MKPSFELVASIIDKLIEDTDYGNIYDYVFDGASDISCWFYEVENYTNFEMAHGYTKIVIESDKLGDWVLKIPILNEKRKDFAQLRPLITKLPVRLDLRDFLLPLFSLLKFQIFQFIFRKKFIVAMVMLVITSMIGLPGRWKKVATSMIPMMILMTPFMKRLLI